MSNAGKQIAFGNVIPEDRVPLPPADAKIFPTGCDYCINGCAYRAIVWPLGKEGGPQAKDNAYGVDFPITESLVGNWATPNQHTIVLRDGEPHHCIVIPAISDRVNRAGNHSIRGGNLAQKCYSPWKPTADRLQTPLLRVRGQLQPISWEDATSIVAEVGRHVIDKYGEHAYGIKTYSYQFWENTYAITKLAFQSIETPSIAQHDKPSWEGDATGVEDAGIPTFGPAYVNYKECEVMFMSGVDAYETKTVLFTEWMMEGGGKFINVLPRKSMGVAWAEKNGGLFLQIVPGTDTVLHNAMCRVILENGWEDKEYIEAWIADDEKIDFGMGRGTRDTPWQWRSTRWGKSFPKYKEWLLNEEYATLDYAEKITGIPRAKIIQAAELLTGGGKGPRPKASFSLEKGNYWSNNYLNTISFLNLALICGAGTREGRIIGRGGGHQRGMRSAGPYPRVKSPFKFGRIGRKAMNLDLWMLGGNLRFAWVIGTQWIEGTMASQYLADYIEKHTIQSPHRVTSFDRGHVIEVLKARADAGDMVIVNNDGYLRTIGNQYADLILPAAHWGEMDGTRAQGERVLRIYSKFYDPPGEAKPDWWIIAQVAKKMGYEGYDWKTAQDVFIEGARFSRNSILDYAPLIFYAKFNKQQPYDLLRKVGARGYVLPLWINDGELLETQRLPDPSKEYPTPQGITAHHKGLTAFGRAAGQAILHVADWRLFKDYWERIKPNEEKGELWVTCGRVNEVWQSLFDDLRKPYIMQRYPMNFVEIHPKDAESRGIANGDIVAIENDDLLVQVSGYYFAKDQDALFTALEKNGHIKVTSGAVTAMAIVTDAIRPGVTFMYFLWPGGPSQNVTHAVPDPISGAPRFKLGKGRFRKIGTIPDHLKARLTFKPKNII